MQDHTQSVDALCGVLARLIDMFGGIGKASRLRSSSIHYMLERSVSGEAGYTEMPEVARFNTLGGLLSDAGFYMLGVGHFSVVMGHDDQPDTAFKLSLKPEDSYVAYAMYCRQNPGKHLPEIRCMIRAREAQVIAIKRYTEFYSGCVLAGIPEVFPSDCYGFMQYWREHEQQRIELRHKPEGYNPIYTSEFLDALVAIGRHFEGAATFDLHSDNLMYDADTECFIITDPVSFKKENTHATRHQRKNSDRTDHFASAEAGTTAHPAARGIGAGVSQMRIDVQAGNPCPLASGQTLSAHRSGGTGRLRGCANSRGRTQPSVRITRDEHAKEYAAMPNNQE